MNRKFVNSKRLILSGLILTIVVLYGNFSGHFRMATASLSSTFKKTQPSSFQALSKAAQGQVEIIAKLSERPGNLAITPDGRIIMSLHPFGKPKNRVVELLPDGSTKPFPNAQWSQAPDANGQGVDAVIGLESDKNGVVWMLDKGGVNGSKPKLVAWDTRQNKLARIISIPEPAFQPNSFMQDLAVDLDNQAIYIADMSRGDLVGVSNPAIIVVDLKTGASRRALENHQSLQPEKANFLIDNQAQTVSDGKGGWVKPDLGLNPITIDPKNEWVYYGAMNSRSLYRIRTKDLINSSLSPSQMGAKVERYGEKAVSDGIAADGAGNVYITDVNQNAIGVTSSNGQYRVLYQDNAVLNWADGMSYGPDGYFYVTVNQLHRHAALNGGRDVSKPPYQIVRFKPLSPSAIGR
ncbi:L-dopachrome tautomerase-related protein [Phormidesmis sp. 146-12]